MTPGTEPAAARIISSIVSGLKRGGAGWLWLLKIIIPVSFVTALLVHFGLIYKLDFIFTPVMNLLRLPPSAVLPLIIGLFTGIYGAVAAMAVLDLTVQQMTLVAVFLLISHNLIQESMVQGQSGFNPFFAAAFRLFMSVLVTFICARLMGAVPAAAVTESAASAVTASVSFGVMIRAWAADILHLAVKILFIIIPLMIVLDMARRFSLIQLITRLCAPVLRLMGLSRSTGMLWLTASFFGLAYGAAVIVEETRTNDYSKDELIRLHLSIGINHAMVEDPSLFLPLGLPAVWLWVPRFVAAVAATYLFFLISHARRLYVTRTGHKKLCNHR